MSFPTLLVALLCVLRAVSARALWIPKELEQDASTWMPEDFTITKRADTCGGESGLSQCGSNFPSVFCCPQNTVCLSLNTTSSLTAALCCPAGQDCATISPVSCDRTFQNATSNPGSQLHSQPTANLDSCGDNCCPMGYRCSGTLCVAMTESEAAEDSSTGNTTTTSPTTTSSSVSDTASSTDSAEEASSTDDAKENAGDSDDFSLKSFVAGFIPGIVLGMFLLAALLFCLWRRKHKKDGSISEKKHYSKDTLTDLGPNASSRRPTVHGRSISEPTVDISLGHRTDFANRTPPEQKNRGVHGGLSGYIVNVESPAERPSNPTPQGKSWLSHSPFVNQVATPRPIRSPIPAHLKRGTLSFDSFKISPVRGLKKQRSRHSLRRESQQATTEHRPEEQLVRQVSAETIKVAMDTPGQNPSTAGTLPPGNYKPHFATLATEPASSNSWQTTQSARSQDSTPIDEEPDYSTPTRPGRNSNIQNIGASLQSPYTPSNYPPTVYDQRASTRTQPQITYPPLPVKASTAPQPYPTPQSSAAHRSFVAPVGHTSTFADTGMPFLRSPNPQPASPIRAPADGKGKPRLTGLFPNWGARDGAEDHRVTRASGLTTWGGMIEKAGLRRSQLYTKEQGDPREWNR
ncbi:hypothetical protein CB0940_11482 [Cercospora beticola]|uniref:Mid2 domain-containing protein n=1 Tax=Cercospora beticola TaxID=122368 RepID=A0A2G5HCM9_CERBT|nr:hypothetical protein CB0940_11482 [Cercospora beticola]PIA90316.1 hypothetical protein CB0940_11482 [Cercospora beticola]WPB08347.1 hypothetical protein RHO25_013013 [Cercospora beticola]CAK1367760.1 unnamed protein product [Cercospora beticola]